MCDNITFFSQLGNTPLHWAIKNGRTEVVRLLLLSQANMEIKNNVSTAIFSIKAIMLHYLMIMVDLNLMGHLVGAWVGVANSKC